MIRKETQRTKPQSSTPVAAPFAESLRREWRQRQTVYESHEWTNNDPDYCARCHVEWDDADITCEATE